VSWARARRSSSSLGVDVGQVADIGVPGLGPSKESEHLPGSQVAGGECRAQFGDARRLVGWAVEAEIHHSHLSVSLDREAGEAVR
jgi:hypothetical protein